MQQGRPQGAVAATQHEHKNHIFKRLIDALPPQQKSRVEHGGGCGGENDAQCIQVERGRQSEAPRVKKTFAADYLRMLRLVLAAIRRSGQTGRITKKAKLDIVFHHSAMTGDTA